ncbi:MAG: sigma-70 family RNA polymerase sigma factor [Chthoniobacteraceae bacterium]
MNEEPSFQADASGDDPARDLRLMERVRKGDVEAFRELVEAHERRVIGTVTRMLGDENEAEDLAQQVFVRVWKSASRWEPTAKFTTWLYTILRNLVFNECRRRSRHPTRSLDAASDDEEHPQQFADGNTKAPDTSLLDAEMQDAIERAIQELPEAQRMAVVMRRYQDVSYEEIAEVLDLTVPAVKSLLFRARTDLREKLKRYLGE